MTSQKRTITVREQPKRWAHLHRRSVTIIFCILLSRAAFGQGPPQDLIRRVDSAEMARETSLAGYTVTERYSVIRNGESQPAADAVVETVYQKDEGKNYTVISRLGSPGLQKLVLNRILEEEKKISKGRARESLLVTSANYTMEFDRDESLLGRNCFVLKLIPRRPSPYLIVGHAWVDSQNYHLVRIAGKTRAMPSIWVGHPMIQRDYQDLQGFALATSSTSESKSLFFGTTMVNIRYENYQIMP